MKTKALVYIFGPMTGKPDLNRAAFEEARLRLEANPNIIAIIPHDIYQPEGPALKCPALAWCEGMLADYPWILQADVLCALPGWIHSRGAAREASIARDHGKRVVALGAPA